MSKKTLDRKRDQVEIFDCPRCALENIKTELKNTPNNYLTCDVCRWVGEEVGGTLVESVL